MGTNKETTGCTQCFCLLFTPTSPDVTGRRRGVYLKTRIRDRTHVGLHFGVFTTHVRLLTSEPTHVIKKNYSSRNNATFRKRGRPISCHYCYNFQAKNFLSIFGSCCVSWCLFKGPSRILMEPRPLLVETHSLLSSKTVGSVLESTFFGKVKFQYLLSNYK